MTWNKSMMINYPLPFNHDDFIRVDLDGVIKDVLLVRCNIFTADAERPDNEFKIQYKDSLGNSYDSVDLCRGFIGFLPKPRIVINENDGVLKTLKKNDKAELIRRSKEKNE